MIEVLKKYKAHIPLVLVMGAIALIFSLHHILMPMYVPEGNSYYPISFTAESDQALAYGPRVNAFVQGDVLVDEISLFEYLGGPTFLPILNPLTFGVFAKLTGSLKNGFMLSDAIFPLISFLLMYVFLAKIAKSKKAALAGATLFLFAPHIGINIPPVSMAHFREFFAELFPFFAEPSYLTFSRFEWPKIAFPFYIGAFYFVYLGLVTGKRLHMCVAGLFLGSLFYTYLYHWMYMFAGLGVMGLVFLKQKEYVHFKRLFIMGTIGVLCSIGYFMNMHTLGQLSSYQDLIGRIGVEEGHAFRWLTWKSYVRAIVLAALVWSIYKTKNSLLGVYLCSLLVSIIIVLNIQIITGINPQTDHWHRAQFFTVFTSLYVVAVWFWQDIVRPDLKKWSSMIVGVVIVGVLFGQGVMQYQYSVSAAEHYALPDAQLAAFAWLNEYTEQNDVVGTLSHETNDQIILHTHNRVFFPNGINTLATDEEIWSRYLALHALVGIPEAYIEASLQPDTFWPTYLFHNGYREGGPEQNTYLLGFKKRVIPKEELTKRLLGYAEMLGSMTAEDIPYKLDYVLIDERGANILENVGIELNASPVYDEAGVRIYSIQNL